MSNMFKPTVPSIASNLGYAPPTPPPAPKVTRMPAETDPSIVQAAQRTRKAALARTGRQSTILTDALRDTVGSSGQALGA